MSAPTVQEHCEELSPHTQRIFWRRCAAFLLLLGVMWLALAAADRALPFIKPGHDQIYLLAFDTVENGVVFPSTVDRTRVALFGDSRVQAGFQPMLFDELSAAATYSFNLGLPNQNRFLRLLRTLVQRDQAPDLVLLTLPWILDAEPERWALISDDPAFIETVLPFRLFFRDITLFLIRSASRGGPVDYYRASKAYVDRARSDRGYFFVEGMSHFPNHSLPEDFRLDSDVPDRAAPREIQLDGAAFEEVLRLRDAADFRVVFVPSYARLGSRAPSEADASVREALARHGIEVRGPDYWLYPNRIFSDPAHVNPEGAATYTRDLWELLAPVIREVSRPGGPATR